MFKIGTPNYNSQTRNSTRKNYFKLKDGDNIYRILPPCFSYAEEGRWAEFYSIHFGYRGSKNAKGVASPKPFVCTLRKDRNKNVIVPCAEHFKTAEVDALLQKRKAELESQHKNSEQVKAALEPLTAYLMDHNNDRKWYVNAKALDGTMGCLKIPHKAFIDLKEDVIPKLISKYGIDPTAADGGVWFNIKRTKTGPRPADVTYKVEVEMEMVETPQGRFETIKKAPLSEEDKKRMETECFDLSKMYTKLTPDQIQKLVDTEGDPTIVDEIFARPTQIPKDEVMVEDEPESSPEVTSSTSSMSPEEFKRRFTS